jgi:cytochrome c553
VPVSKEHFEAIGRVAYEWSRLEFHIQLVIGGMVGIGRPSARNAPEDAAMRGFVATMSDADMLEIAKYASTQPWPKVEPISIDTALLKKGAYATAMVGCGGCHFNDWKGFSANPRVGDQSTAYLAATIRQFRSGSRANSPGMSDLARTLDEGDIDAVAAYLNAVQ